MEFLMASGMAGSGYTALTAESWHVSNCCKTCEDLVDLGSWKGSDTDIFKIQWNLSYLNPLGPGVVHKSKKSVSLKLCINNLKIA